MQSIDKNLAVGLLVTAVAASSLALMTGATSAWLVAIAGLFFVFGGTLLTAILSEGYQRVAALAGKLPRLFQHSPPTLGDDEQTFLQVATFYRRGSVRMAEMSLKGIADSYLKLGSQLIIDRCSEKELTRALHWQTSSVQEQDRRDLRILHSMLGFAPAFGMLGTLLGLVRLLFSLGDSGLETVGAAMGFAMITTVYGLVASNLLIKPVAIKLEQRLREQLAWQRVKYELMMLLYEKAHPSLIQETLDAFETGKPVTTRPETVTTASMASA